MTIIVNGTLVTPDGERRTSLAVLDGKIKMIGEIEPREGDEVLDASLSRGRLPRMTSLPGRLRRSAGARRR